MMFYRVHRKDNSGESFGFMWFRTMREAVSAARKWRASGSGTAEAEIRGVDINPTKAGILAMLNRYADHADNG